MQSEKFDLVLASASPRRKELLEKLGLRLSVVPAELDESKVAINSPAQIVTDLAKAKAELIASRNPSRFTLGADTIVVLWDDKHFKMLGKPESPTAAEEMLRSLSARSHSVFSGYHLVCPDTGQSASGVVESKVVFNPLEASEIAAYVASGEPMDKAGAYGVQGVAEGFISNITGSYSNIVGLPLAEVLKDLKRFGIWQPSFLSRGEK